MAHAGCHCGNSLWNGDGKPEVHAFRFDILYEYAKNHDDAYIRETSYDAENLILNKDYSIDKKDGYPKTLIEDFVDGTKDDYDIWFCDECKGFFVFDIFDNRYDYELTNNSELLDYSTWDRFFAFRDQDYLNFLDDIVNFYLPSILDNYHFKNICYVSPEKDIIYVFDYEGNLKHTYKLIGLTNPTYKTVIKDII